jgi:hypothetical protein
MRYLSSPSFEGIVYLLGDYNASTNTPDLDTAPSGVKRGDMYHVSVAGNFFTTAVNPGDLIIAKADNASAEADWIIRGGGGEINYAPDTDVTMTYGRVKLGYLTGAPDVVAFGHYDHFSVNNVALIQESTGATILNAESTQSIQFFLGGPGSGTQVLSVDASSFYLPSVPLKAMENTDSVHILGRARIGYDGTNADTACFAHYDYMTDFTYAVRQDNTGITRLNSNADLILCTGGSDSARIDSSNGRFEAGFGLVSDYIYSINGSGVTLYDHIDMYDGSNNYEIRWNGNYNIVYDGTSKLTFNSGSPTTLFYIDDGSSVVGLGDGTGKVMNLELNAGYITNTSGSGRVEFGTDVDLYDSTGLVHRTLYFGSAGQIGADGTGTYLELRNGSPTTYLTLGSSYLELGVGLEVNGQNFYSGGQAALSLQPGALGTPNYINISNSDSLGSPYIEAVGGDANINLILKGKGTGYVTMGSSLDLNGYTTLYNGADYPIFKFNNGANATANCNYLEVNTTDGTGSPALYPVGTGTSINLLLMGKGTGDVNIASELDMYDYTGLTSKKIKWGSSWNFYDDGTGYLIFNDGSSDRVKFSSSDPALQADTLGSIGGTGMTMKDTLNMYDGSTYYNLYWGSAYIYSMGGADIILNNGSSDVLTINASNEVVLSSGGTLDLNGGQITNTAGSAAVEFGTNVDMYDSTNLAYRELHWGSYGYIYTDGSSKALILNNGSSDMLTLQNDSDTLFDGVTISGQLVTDSFLQHSLWIKTDTGSVSGIAWADSGSGSHAWEMVYDRSNSGKLTIAHPSGPAMLFDSTGTIECAMDLDMYDGNAGSNRLIKWASGWNMIDSGGSLTFNDGSSDYFALDSTSLTLGVDLGSTSNRVANGFFGTLNVAEVANDPLVGNRTAGDVWILNSGGVFFKYWDGTNLYSIELGQE